MIKTIRGSIILYLTGVVAIGSSQQPYEQLPCYYMPNWLFDIPGPQPFYDCGIIGCYNYLDMWLPLDWNGDHEVSMTASNQFEICQGTQIVSSNGGSVSLLIGNTATDEISVAWYEPLNTPGEVLRYEKIEIGIGLPTEVEEAIDNFITNTETGSNLSPSINPFNPDEIDVRINVVHDDIGFFETGDTYFGFFYQDFSRNTTDLDSDNWFWEEIPTDHRFRIRMTPEYSGKYMFNVGVNVNGYYYGTWFYQFEVLPNSDNGFVKVSPNGHYLMDNSGIFIPVGQNQPMPDCECDLDVTGIDNPTCAQCYTEGSADPCCQFNGSKDAWSGNVLDVPVFVRYEKDLEELASAGANSFRLIVAPWSWEIEFEKLNNYYSRMNMAWEMDRVLDKAKALDLKIDLNMKIQYTLENPSYYGMYSWDWDYDKVAALQCINPNDQYCYHDELDLESPIEFFIDENAKDKYKDRLRYMIARWGYSPEIYLFELYSEIQGVGSGVDPVAYHYDPWGPDFICAKKCDDPRPNDYYLDSFGNQIPYLPEDCTSTLSEDERFVASQYEIDEFEVLAKEAISNWHSEMAGYIKGYLNHDCHLIGANYAGIGPADNETLIDPSNPFDNLDCSPGNSCFDDSWCSSDIDVSLWNNYSAGETRFKSMVEEYYQFGIYDCSSNPLDLVTLPTKPLLYGENGSGAFMDCDYTTWQKDLWCLPFTGHASTGMSWDERHTYDLWEEFGQVNNFLNNVFLEDPDADELLTSNNWAPGYSLMNEGDNGGLFNNEDTEKQAECVFMKYLNPDNRKAYGVILNRTYNFYTYNNGTCPDYDLTLMSDDIENLSNVTSWDFYENDNLSIPGMGGLKKYQIDYYDKNTGEIISSEEECTGLSGNLFLHFPTLYYETRPIIPFSVKFLENCLSSVEMTLDNSLPILTQSSPMAVGTATETTPFITGLAFEIYPNPSQGIATIQIYFGMMPCKLTVYDGIGQLVQQEDIQSMFSVLDFSLLAKGIYRFEVQSGEFSMNKPFIKL